jgi:hypothetical protein
MAAITTTVPRPKLRAKEFVVPMQEYVGRQTGLSAARLFGESYNRIRILYFGDDKEFPDRIWSLRHAKHAFSIESANDEGARPGMLIFLGRRLEANVAESRFNPYITIVEQGASGTVEVDKNRKIYIEKRIPDELLVGKDSPIRLLYLALDHLRRDRLTAINGPATLLGHSTTSDELVLVDQLALAAECALGVRETGLKERLR